MADAQVQTAIAHWGPRCIHNGVDYNDFVAITQRCDSWAEWLDEWSLTADAAADLARLSEERGHDVTAGRQWLRASATRHFGKFVWMLDRERHAEATLKSVEEMNAGHRMLKTGAERLEMAAGDIRAVGNLRLPGADGRAPLVVLIPGLDSTKEEFFRLEAEFLDRGMATLSIDGPGQGEVGLQTPIRHDYEVCVPPMLDALADREDLDFDRIGIFGVSLGGYYAPRVAAHEPRARAVVGLSGPYSVPQIWGALPPMSKATFAAKVHATDDREALERLQQLDLTGVCERISIPALYVTGKLDRLVPWEQTERMAKESPHGEFVLFDDGNHGCSNVTSVARALVADWMLDRLNGIDATASDRQIAAQR